MLAEAESCQGKPSDNVGFHSLVRPNDSMLSFPIVATTYETMVVVLSDCCSFSSPLLISLTRGVQMGPGHTVLENSK